MKTITTLCLMALCAVGICQSRSIIRYGALFDTRAHSWAAVTGVKAYEIDLGSAKFTNPEVWAAGSTTGTGSAFNLILAEPWKVTRTITLYPLASASYQDKRARIGLGVAIQLTVLKF